MISGGHTSDASGGVAGAYQATGAHVFHTARDGAVRFVLSPHAITAAHWGKGGWEASHRDLTASKP